MELKKVIRKGNYNQYKKLANSYSNFEKLLEQLQGREIPSDIINMINQEVDTINNFQGRDKDLRRQISQSQTRILDLLEKKLKLVPRDAYRNRWLSLGMAIFGVPMGIALGVSLHNMAFIGIGIPIGLAIGLAIGADMDKKAASEGRQLDWGSVI